MGLIARYTGCELYKCIRSEGWMKTGDLYWVVQSKSGRAIIWDKKHTMRTSRIPKEPLKKVVW